VLITAQRFLELCSIIPDMHRPDWCRWNAVSHSTASDECFCSVVWVDGEELDLEDVDYHITAELKMSSNITIIIKHDHSLVSLPHSPPPPWPPGVIDKLHFFPWAVLTLADRNLSDYLDTPSTLMIFVVRMKIGSSSFAVNP